MNINDEFYNRELRCGQLFYLPMVIGMGSMHSLYEAVEEYWHEVINAMPNIKKQMEEIGKVDELHFEIEDVFVENCTELNGYLARFEMPYRTYIEKDVFKLSWNNYRYVWIYAESMNDLVKKATTWADERIIEDLKTCGF